MRIIITCLLMGLSCPSGCPPPPFKPKNTTAYTIHQMARILSTNRRLVFVFGVLVFLMCFVASGMGESARSARKVAAASEFDEEETEALKDWEEDGEWDEEEDEDQDLEDGFEDEEEDEFEDEEDGFEEEDEREMTDYEAEEEDDIDDEGPEWDEALDQIEDGDGPSLDLGDLEGLIDKEDLMRKLEEMGLDLDVSLLRMRFNSSLDMAFSWKDT